MRNLDHSLVPFVGRQDELNFLQQSMKDVVTRHKGGLIFLTGEAGVGKSQLVKEFTALNHHEVTVIFSGECLANQPRASYWVFLDILRNSLNVTEETPAAEIKTILAEKIIDLVSAEVEETLPYLEYLLSIPQTDPARNQRIDFLDSDRLRQKIFRSVRNYLQALARQQPVLLILEDLLEADQPSFDLLFSLLDLIAEMPILVIAVSRPFLHGPLKKLRDTASVQDGLVCQSLYLSHLDLQDCDTILNQFLSVHGLSVRMRERIVEHSQGIPLYLEEIVHMLIDWGVLRRDKELWKIDNTTLLDELYIPATLLGLVYSRYERLDLALKTVLQAASVIGRRFNREVLKNTLKPMDPAQVDLALEALVDRGFLINPDQSRLDFREFAHNLTAEIIYTALDKREKGRLHGRVGQALEAYYADQISSQVDLLARHFGWSDQKESALNYLFLAGKKAARSHLNTQARSYFDNALRLLVEVNAEPVMAFAVYMGLGDVLFLAGEYLNARAQYEKAFETLGVNPGIKYLGQACKSVRKIGATFEKLGDFDQALVYLVRAKNMVEDRSRPFPEEESQVMNDMGWVHFRLGNFLDAEKELIHALPLAQQAGRHDITASIYNRLGGIYWQKDDLAKATNFVQKSLALRKEFGDTVAVARSYNNLGLLDWKRGKWESALQNFEHSLALHTNLGDIEGYIDVQGNLGLLQLDRGQLEAAKIHLNESLAKAQQTKHSYIIAMTLMYFSRLHITQGNWTSGLKYACESQAAFDEIGARDEFIDVFTLIGQAYIGLDRLEEAVNWAEKVEYLIPKNESGDFSVKTVEGGRGLRLIAEVRRLQGDYVRAGALYKICTDLFDQLGNSLECGRTLMSRARLAVYEGDLDGARLYLSESRQKFLQLGAEFDLQNVDRFLFEVDSIQEKSEIELT